MQILTCLHLTATDRSKIEVLTNLDDLSLNQNPLGSIPLFNTTKVRHFSLQDTSLISARFPLSYDGSRLQTISLSHNKILSIGETDFIALAHSGLKKLHLTDASISTIDRSAFAPLKELQALSLENNQLKSCEFLPSARLLSSIKLDGNRFTSLPQQLASPGSIKTYSFTRNSISIIDESSPLATWSKRNYTNIKVYLANNSFDCCQSFWFIRFLKLSPQSIGDPSLLTCSTPKQFTGLAMLNLNPDTMNCASDQPNTSWFTVGRIIGLAVGAYIILISIPIAVYFLRHKPSRSGYAEIDGYDTSSQPAPPLPHRPSTIPEEDIYNPETGFYAGSVITSRSEPLTDRTNVGIYPVDPSLDGISHIDDQVLLSVSS